MAKLIKDYIRIDLATRVTRWTLLLEKFNYSIKQQPASKISYVQALS